MQEVLARQIADFLKTAHDVDTPVDFSRPDPVHGDVATNIAMKLAKQLGKNPREIAEELVAHIREAKGVAEVSIAAPGFINIRVSDEALWQGIEPNSIDVYSGKKMLVEYSDPNPFKPLHAGHLYTTLVGDALARLVENGGAETIRLNYSGDVGLHVGRCMWGILRDLGGEHPDKLATVPEHERASWMGRCYVQGNEAYESDETAKTEIIDINKRVYALHDQADHDSPFAQIYWTCRQWSYDYFRQLYKQLQVAPFDMFIPESEVTPLGVKTVEEQLEKGVFEKSDGAVVFRGDEQQGLHTRVFINSVGLPTYETKDVGLSLTKWQRFAGFDTSVIITDFSQGQYMQVVLAAMKQFNPEPAERTRHLTHGRVKLKGGVKISSRKGNGPSALDIIESARAAMEETGREVREETVLAAVKYAFAKVKIGNDVVYDPKESIALEGNSGPYLQYAHARACSILAKAENQPASIDADFETGERALALKLSEYPEVLTRSVQELMPHHICTYLYELAQEFNRFYEKNRVVGDEREAIRLALVGRYQKTLQHGLGLLGIIAPEKL